MDYGDEREFLLSAFHAGHHSSRGDFVGVITGECRWKMVWLVVDSMGLDQAR
jgi:hypothetical protein